MIKPKQAQPVQRNSKARAKSANLRKAKRQARAAQEVKGEKVLGSSVVIMNDKKMAVAKGTTTKGVVSLYNKGFVPKKTGKVATRSKFFAGTKQFYLTSNGENPRAHEIEESHRKLGMVRTLSDNEDLEQYYEGRQTFNQQQQEQSAKNFEIESGYASFSNIKLELRQRARERAREAAIHDSIVAQK